MRTLTGLIATTLLFLSFAAKADQADLYGKPIPKEAAFVRALGFGESETPTAFGTSLPSNGDYTVILAQSHEDLAPGQYITVLPTGAILHDPQSDTAKVQIMLINQDYPKTVVLKTADGKVDIASAAQGGAGFREVNPIVVPVAVFDGSTMIGEPFELQLMRGSNPTILVDVAGTAYSFVSQVIWDE